MAVYWSPPAAEERGTLQRRSPMTDEHKVSSEYVQGIQTTFSFPNSFLRSQANRNESILHILSKYIFFRLFVNIQCLLKHISIKIYAKLSIQLHILGTKTHPD